MGCGETTRAIQYLGDYWGPLPPPSFMGLTQGVVLAPGKSSVVCPAGRGAVSLR